MKKILLAILTIVLFISPEVLAYNTAGCRLDIDSALFNHPYLSQLTWKSEISEYDYLPSGTNPNRLRIEFNSVGFGGQVGNCYVGVMIQNVGHTFTDDYCGRISQFPAVGLYLSSLQPDWPDSSHGVSLNVDPNKSPQFGRVFEDVDGLGHCGKNIYSRQNIGDPSTSNPIVVKWTVTKGETVVNPQVDISKDLNCNWISLVGTFVKWNFEIEINGISYDVADYYLPIEKAEYILSTDPLVLHQEYFGSAQRILDAQKGTVKYSDIKASDGANWYDLKDWILTWRIDDVAGNLDERFGWKSDGSSLISRVGHEEDVNEASRDVGTIFRLSAYPIPTFNEGNTRHVMLDIVLGDVMGYYRQQLQLNPNQPDIVEAIRRLESGVIVTNADQFERKIIGTWALVYKGTDTLIRDNMEIKLSTDPPFTGQSLIEIYHANMTSPESPEQVISMTEGMQWINGPIPPIISQKQAVLSPPGIISPVLATYDSCTSSGGSVVTMRCCKSVSDFPNTCLIGACGCSPENSKPTKVCDCGPGRCFNGTACVGTAMVI